MRLSLFLFVAATLGVPSTAFIPALQRSALKAELRRAIESKDESSVIDAAEKLAKFNPTTDIIKDFGKLEGDWKLDFTTAPVSEVPDEEGTGFKTFQSIDAEAGIIYNVIDRGLPEKGLRIGVGAEPTRKGRVALDFRTIEAFNDRFPRKVTLRFPPRELIKAISKAGAALSGKNFDEREFKEIAHFDVLFLDQELRVQRNSEGNLFVNSRISL